MTGARPRISEPLRQRLLWLAAGLLVAWQLVGALPFSPVESDGIGVALGAAQRWTDPARCPELAYNFHGTSGTYVALGGVWQLLHGDIFALYSVLTALAAVLGFALLTRFVARRLQVPLPETALLIALFLPEFLAGSWFANTNTLALVPMGAALLLTLRSGWRWAALTGLALGVAGWMRGDLAAEGLGVAALLFRGDARSRRAWLDWLGTAAICGVVAASTALGLMAASGASLAVLRKTLSGAAGLPAPTSGSGLPVWLVGHITFAPVATYLLLVVALVVLVRERRWSILVPVLAGAPFWWIIVSPYLATPKGLLNIIPYLALAIVFAAHWLMAQRTGAWRWVRRAIAAALVLQALVGVRVTLAAKPWLRQDGPTALRLLDRARTGAVARVEVVIGSGTIVPTDDSVRLASGTLFAPWVSHVRHVERAAGMAQLVQVLRGPDVAPALATQMVEGAQNARLALHRAGYRCVRGYRDATGVYSLLDYERPAAPGQLTTQLTQILTGDSSYALATLAAFHLRRTLYVIGSGREFAEVVRQAPEARVLANDGGFLPVAALEYDQARHDAPPPSR